MRARLNRRSTARCTRRRTGLNNAAAASVEAADLHAPGVSKEPVPGQAPGPFGLNDLDYCGFRPGLGPAALTAAAGAGGRAGPGDRREAAGRRHQPARNWSASMHRLRDARR